MKKLIIVAALVLLSAGAQTQSKWSKLAGLGGGNLTSSQDQLAIKFAIANKHVLEANGNLYDALGLKDQAAQARTEHAALEAGATLDNLKAADKASKDNREAVSAAFKDPPEMDEQAKASFNQGLILLARALLDYIAMKNDVMAFGNSFNNASPAMIPRLATGAYIIVAFPRHIKHLVETLHDAVEFAKAHDIAVPPDATNALGAM
ncbi:MAG: hypothetical protein FWD64_03490 [Acidobacteriaceae bacterium]|nr:hypothetical protein [Acidobacteriaceae bacterium]